jgi:hypothetical protein
MDETRARFGDDLGASAFSSDDVRLAENDAAAVAAHGIDFGFRRVGRHHNVRGDAAQTCGPGERGGVITGGMGGDSGRGFGVGELEHGVNSAAGFKRADFLEIFALKKKMTAAERIERGTRKHRRTVDFICDPRVRSANICEGERGVHEGKVHSVNSKLYRLENEISAGFTFNWSDFYFQLVRI